MTMDGKLMENLNKERMRMSEPGVIYLIDYCNVNSTIILVCFFESAWRNLHCP